MSGINRRDFIINSLAGVVCIDAGMKKYSDRILDGKYDKEWDEAIEENKNRALVEATDEHVLRREVGNLMKEWDVEIVYTHLNKKRGGNVSVFNFSKGDGFFNGDFPVRHLKKVRGMLYKELTQKENFHYTTIFVSDDDVSFCGKKDNYRMAYGWGIQNC